MSALILTRPLMRNRLSAEIENILLKSIIKGQLVVEKSSLPSGSCQGP